MRFRIENSSIIFKARTIYQDLKYTKRIISIITNMTDNSFV